MWEDVAPVGFASVIVGLLALRPGDGHTHNLTWRTRAQCGWSASTGFDLTFSRTSINDDVPTPFQRWEHEPWPAIGFTS
jgi:hypothetical protein